MVLITSDSYKSYIQSQLHDFADNSLASIRKVAFSKSGFDTWDEWAAYFEQKDLDTLNLREQGIFLILCVRMQRNLVGAVSDSSFAWDTISSEGEAFHLKCALELEEYLYETRIRSTFKKVTHNFAVLMLSVELWTNLFDVISYYDELCHEYIQIILKANRECVEKNIAADREGIVHAFDRSGEPLTYNVKDLYWNHNAYEYLKEQEEIFSFYLPKLIEQYGGKYIIFESGKVIDFDDKEMNLLERISNNKSYDNRPGIFCKFVPEVLESRKVNA